MTTPVPTPGSVPNPAAMMRPRPAAAKPAAAARPASDPTKFGRIGDDGTIYLTTPDGEIVVAIWAAGDPAEGLALYGRKYDDLVAEVALAQSRLDSGKGSSEDAAATIERTRAALAAPSFVGDIAALNASLDTLTAGIEAAKERATAARKAARAAAAEVREALVAEAETLAPSEQWKSAGERIKAILDEWKTAPHADRAVEQELWDRLKKARNTFDRRRRAHFATLDAARKESVAAREEIIAEAEALANSTDWADTARAFRNLLDRWKAAPRGSRTEDDKLWARFKAASDTFHNARSADLDQRDAEFAVNATAKEALLVEAEALLPITDVKAAQKAMRPIRDKWEAIGHVPRADKARIEGRLNAVEDAIKAAEAEQWRRSNPEARARAAETTAAFTAKLEKLDKQLAKAKAANDARGVAAAESAIASTKELLAAAQGALADFTS